MKWMRFVAAMMLAGWSGMARATVLVVDAAGGGTHLQIQDALIDADSGDEIVVRQGVYLETIDFLGKAVVLRSEFPQDPACQQATVIDASQSGSAVIFTAGEPPTAIFEGFTIRNGFASGSGGGIICSNGASPTIRHNRIVGNEAWSDGGGIYVGPGSSPLIIANTIYGNITGGRGAGVYVSQASASLVNNIIDANQAGCSAGGGLYLAGGSDSTQVTGNLISRNLSRLGGGVAVSDASVALTRNRIIGNRGWPRGGGLSLVNADAILFSNVIAGNRAEIGSAIDGNASDAQVLCNTIAGNWATDAAMLLFISGSQVELTGNILADSRQGVAVQAISGSVVNASYNNFFDNADGSTAGAVNLGGGNLFVAPMLMVPGAWVVSALAADDNVAPPCGGEFHREFGAVNFSPPDVFAGGYAHYRIRLDRKRFEVQVDGFPPGSHDISINSRVVGQIVVSTSGSGWLNYDSNDGTFPAGFPEVLVGDALTIGGLVSAPLDPAWAVAGEVWQMGNPHLQPDSPMLNAGSPGAAMADAVDLDGQTRLAGLAVDIGADELQPAGKGDADHDGDRDLADFASYQRCSSAAHTALPDPICGFADLDGDGGVDTLDWQWMAGQWTGPRELEPDGLIGP